MAAVNLQDSDGSDLDGGDSGESDYENVDQYLEEANQDQDIDVNLEEANQDQDMDVNVQHDGWIFENFRAPNIEPYTLGGGATAIHPIDARPGDYFDLFWTEELWTHLVTETNRYARQEREKNPPPQFAPVWEPVDIEIMKAFIGLCLAMGILQLPCRNDYWRVGKPMFKTSFNSIMPRDRFNFIWRYLHLSNNEAPRPDVPDKLSKVRFYIDYLNERFRENYTSYGNDTIDETMIKFKGRLGFRQYMPAKPIKWGIKVWSLAESTTGYLERFQVYTGKEAGRAEIGLAHRVVSDLSEHLADTHIRLYMDNYFTGIPLFNDLLAKGIYACGTVRSNRRGLPLEILPKNVRLEKHQYKVAQFNNIACTTWQDTKPVMFLSTFHHPGEIGAVKRRSGRAVQQEIAVPKMVSNYQENMKGVDLCDQMVGYYLLNHRSKKWWRRIFFHFLVASVHNSFIVAKDIYPERMKVEYPNFQDYIEDLIHELIGDIKAGRDAPVRNEGRAARRHDVERIFAKAKVCVECRVRADRAERVGTTKFGCRQCGIPVHVTCVAAHIGRCNHLV